MRKAGWGWGCAMHGKCPEKQPDSGKAERLQGRTWRGEAQTLTLLEMLAAFLRFPALPSDPHVTPGCPRHCGAGEHLRGTWSAGPGSPFRPSLPL